MDVYLKAARKERKKSGTIVGCLSCGGSLGFGLRFGGLIFHSSLSQPVLRFCRAPGTSVVNNTECRWPEHSHIQLVGELLLQLLGQGPSPSPSSPSLLRHYIVNCALHTVYPAELTHSYWLLMNQLMDGSHMEMEPWT